MQCTWLYTKTGIHRDKKNKLGNYVLEPFLWVIDQQQILWHSVQSIWMVHISELSIFLLFQMHIFTDWGDTIWSDIYYKITLYSVHLRPVLIKLENFHKFRVTQMNSRKLRYYFIFMSIKHDTHVLNEYLFKILYILYQ